MTEVEPQDLKIFEEPISPYKIVETWLEEARSGPLMEASSMVVSTCVNNRPSSRVVLLKEIRPEEGFVFYTNYDSHKGKDISENPYISANLFWDHLARQIVIQGEAIRVPRAESLDYWRQRPRESQISQFISKQSVPVTSRAFLTDLYVQAEKEFEGKEVPCPENWGGYLIQATYMEFWLGRPKRFHDRLVFEKEKPSSEKWEQKRLYP